jgi:hypothetical protein
MPSNTTLQQVQMAQMAATQRNMPGAFMQGGYAVYSQGCGGMPNGGGCGYGGQMSGCAEKGLGRGRGDSAKGKGKSKGKFGGKLGGGPPAFGGGLSDAAADAAAAGDPRKQIELAQRRAKLRDRSAISQAQRSAQERFEKDLLDRVQGNWVDASDTSVCYEVEGNLCAVSGGDNTRTFRNRIGVYAGELCWDARRFWHYLDLNAMPSPGEEVERVEWKPGEGSPPTKPIIWIRAPPKPEGGDEPEGKEADGPEGADGEGAAEEKQEGAVEDQPAA